MLNKFIIALLLGLSLAACNKDEPATEASTEEAPAAEASTEAPAEGSSSNQ